MKYFELDGCRASRVVQGCMRISGLDQAALDRLIRSDLEQGINFFDHADIYGGGECERKFGQVLRADPTLRDRMWIQTKCGIRRGWFDFSKEHILASAEAALERLQTDHIDFLLLHRPDTLCEPEEVAEAFETLFNQGKVLHFGVSNETPMQISLLQKYVKQKICVNQLQFGLGHTGMVDQGLNANMTWDAGLDRDGGVLDYCRLHDITIQPWSPFQYGYFEGSILDNPKFPELNAKLKELAQAYDVTPAGMAIAWILRHSACMQPVVGSTNPEHMAAICKASDVTITRQEWYQLYCATGKTLP